jgi:hypothetical protein
MKTKKIRKLDLAKTTVRALTGRQLEAVVGASAGMDSGCATCRCQSNPGCPA